MPLLFARATFAAILLSGWMLGDAPAIGQSASMPSPILECQWADTPPVIDGRDDDDVWRGGVTTSDFKQAWLPGAPAARQATRVKLRWDREWLYFLAEMSDRDITATVREHDGPMYKNDVFELFLRPSAQHAGYYEFEVNPHQAVLDAFFPTSESWRDPQSLRRGAFHVEAKVQVRGTLNESSDLDSGWTVEGRIPWSDFNPTGGRPESGETWSVNLCRIDGTETETELSCVAPLLQPRFHRTAEFAPLRFVGPPGLTRHGWTNTKLLGSPDGPQGFAPIRAWPGLAARSLVATTPTPDGEWLWFIEQENGRGGRMRLRRFNATGNGSDAETLLELNDMAYSVAFHPQFDTNHFVFIGMNGPQAGSPRTSHVSRFTVREGRPDPASAVKIIEWSSDGHNGAALAFADNGLLFVSSGDGTSHSDLDEAGQNLRSLRSKILRIDVDHPSSGKGYSIPADNPFVQDSRFAPETWAYGLRNPWRLTYDTVSGQLWAGENGQDAWEYARLIRRGENYGWSVYEGAHVFRKTRPLGPHPVTFPTLEFSHAEFRSLTGGMVYRGRLFPELVGAYLFGDFGTGRVWAAKHDGTRLEWMRELVDTPFSLTHVSADSAGEVLLVDYGVEGPRGQGAGGGIFRLQHAPAPTQALADFPRRLSETGLFSDAARLEPSPGVIPYEINLPAWHDGAVAQHLLALPQSEAIEVRPTKSWDLPDGAVLAQTLTLAGRRVETRILVKQQNDFAAYTYIWNADQTDAVLAPKTGTDLETTHNRPWRVPSRAECMMCHSREANFSLSLHEFQLNRGDQLNRWEQLGLLRTDVASFERSRRRDESSQRGSRPQPNQRPAKPSALLPRNPANLGTFNASATTAATLDKRARNYLAVNCAHCHTLNGGGNSVMNFDWLVSGSGMRALGEPPQHGDFGLANARIIAPGAPGQSVIIPRVAMRGPGQMPPVGSRSSDPDGVRLLAEWITSLPAKAPLEK